MTESEWNEGVDAGQMLDCMWRLEGHQESTRALRAKGGWSASDATDLDRALHRFYLASCRRIWPLLPQVASRRGVEMGEQFAAGEVSEAELYELNYEVEGAAFFVDYDTEPTEVARLVSHVSELPSEQLRSMLNPPEAASELQPRELLVRAAYFADYAMMYPSLRPKGPPPDTYRVFLSAVVLREHVSYPERASRGEPSA